MIYNVELQKVAECTTQQKKKNNVLKNRFGRETFCFATVCYYLKLDTVVWTKYR